MLKTADRRMQRGTHPLTPKTNIHPMPDGFAKGDRVQLLDEDLEGEVLSIGPVSIRIRTPDGMELDVPPSELIRIPGSATSDFQASGPPPEPETGKPRKPTRGRVSGKKDKAPPFEVDLHAEKLFPDLRRVDPYDILDRQVATARHQLEFAIRKRIQRIVFIHGVGQGVLREELRSLFRRYEGIRYYDADFRVYGEGATEVYIPQSLF